MILIYFILIAAAIASAFIILAIYLSFYNKKINERLQNNIRNEKPLPNMRKVTVVTFICAVLICTVLALLITFIKQQNKSDIKPFQDETLHFYFSPEPASGCDIPEDMFCECHDGAITFFKSKVSAGSSKVESSDGGLVTVDLVQPAFILSMELPSDIAEKADGMGISGSYLIGNGIAASVEYTCPSYFGDTLWKCFTDRPGQFAGKIYYYIERADGSHDILYEESIVIDVE